MAELLDMSGIKMTEEELAAERYLLQQKIAALKAEVDAKEGLEKSTEEVDGFTLPLDTEDKLRLENLVLRERLAERDRADARSSFYIYLSKKYDINPDEQDLSVDATTMKMTLTDK
jgi:hypothetical protein